MLALLQIESVKFDFKKSNVADFVGFGTNIPRRKCAQLFIYISYFWWCCYLQNKQLVVYQKQVGTVCFFTEFPFLPPCFLIKVSLSSSLLRFFTRAWQDFSLSYVELILKIFHSAYQNQDSISKSVLKWTLI